MSGVTEKDGLQALGRLIESAGEHRGTRSASVIRKVVLSLYNSHRHPLDVRELQMLDEAHRRDVLAVIDLQCRPMQKEIQDRIPDGEDLIEEYRDLEGVD